MGTWGHHGCIPSGCIHTNKDHGQYCITIADGNKADIAHVANVGCRKPQSCGHQNFQRSCRTASAVHSRAADGDNEWPYTLHGNSTYLGQQLYCRSAGPLSPGSDQTGVVGCPSPDYFQYRFGSARVYSFLAWRQGHSPCSYP